MQSWTWIAWNIFLALIPAAAGQLLAEGITRWTLERKQAPWLVWLPLALLWFAFLPNTCYLLTEWRHFLLDPHFTERRDAFDDNRVLLVIARQSFRFLVYTSVGVLSFALAIRPVERLLRRMKAPAPLLAVPFFFLTSLAVYMGLIVRLNSWNLINHPDVVVNAALHALVTPLLLKVIVIFAFLLWVLYEIVDIWVDGVVLRLAHQNNTTSISEFKL